jgi:GxxExxY protein
LSARRRWLLRRSSALVIGAPASQAETQQKETEITEKKSENSVSSVCSCLRAHAKAVEKVLPIHKAQLLSYTKLLNVPVGLLINFHEMKLTDGISRLILPGANQ